MCTTTSDESQKNLVDTIEVLTQFCKSVMESDDEDDTKNKDNKMLKIAICNIILQRISSIVRLPRSSLADLEKRIHAGTLGKHSEDGDGGSSSSSNGGINNDDDSGGGSVEGINNNIAIEK